MGARRKARELALQMLFQHDMSGNAPDMIIDTFEELQKSKPNTREFATKIFRGTVEHMASIDEMIQAQAENWRLSRMAGVDRNIIRMSIYEFLHEDDTPEAGDHRRSHRDREEVRHAEVESVHQRHPGRDTETVQSRPGCRREAEAEAGQERSPRHSRSAPAPPLRKAAAMSLLGRLEDLSLTDIVQIVYLSRRTGVLEIINEAAATR